MLTLLLAVALSACAFDSGPPDAVELGEYASNADTKKSSSAADVVVALAQDGERGDLPALMAQHPDMAEVLARRLTPLVESEIIDVERSFGSKGHAVVVFSIVGAETKQDESALYADFLLQFYTVKGGHLVELSGMRSVASILVSESLKPLALEVADEFRVPSTRLRMPDWASERIGGVDSLRAEREAAGRWARTSGKLPDLVPQAESDHKDPHGHSPDVYSLDAIPPGRYGYAVRRVAEPGSSEGALSREFLYDVGRSPDGRFQCFIYDDGGCVAHDVRSDEWLHVKGPSLDSIDHETVAWVGHTLVFDNVDMGYEDPTGEELTFVHIEADLDELKIERVVPMGPQSGNRRR